MIDLPVNLVLPALEEKLKRGAVLRTLFQFENNDYFKRLIILNNQFSLDDIYFVFTTSQVEYFITNKDVDLIKLNTLFFRPGETFLNPDKEMIIDCRKVRQISKESLAKNWNNHRLDFLGEIPFDIMGKIDNILKSSNLISPKIKQYVLID
jgi:hypothetical protein